MKTLKTNLFANIFKAASLLLCVTFVACSGLNGVSDKEESSSSASSAGGKAYISAIDFGTGRTILPSGSFDLKGDGIYKFVLKGTPEGGEEVEFTPWVRTDEDYAFDCMDNDLRNRNVEIAAGTWTFTIKVYVLPEGVSYTADDAESQAILVLEKTTDPVTIVSGFNRIRFGTLNEAAGNGTLALTLRFPDEGVQSVKVSMTPQNEGNTYSVAERALAISDAVGGYRSVLFTDDHPARGWYIVKFAFTINNGVENTSQVYSELVQIATGRKTEATVTVDSLNTLYPLHFNFKGGTPTASNLPASYSPYSNAIPMPGVNPRNGATFDGWFSDSQYRNRVTQLDSGSKGEKTFYAKWKYDVETGKLYAGGAKVIIQAENDTVVHAYFDAIDDDNVVLADDGSELNIGGWEVYGSKMDGSYPDGTTDDITIEGGIVSKIYARGNGGSVTVNEGTVTVVYMEGNSGTVTVNGGTVKGDNRSASNEAIYVSDTNATVNIKGGTIGGKVTGSVAGTTTIKASGSPVVGNGRDIGIDLAIAKNAKLTAGNLNYAGDETITLLAPSALEGTPVATFSEATAYAKSFVVINSNRKRVVKVSGSDIVVEGGLSLPSLVNTDPNDENAFTLEGGNITKNGTIFCVFAEGGYFTLGETTLTGGHFDMGIPVDANGKEKTFVYTADTREFYRYIQFTSTNGEINANAADTFLTHIQFHKINNKPITVRINLETVPITGTGYKLNDDVFYLDGSFYKAVYGHKTWSDAYNAAKQQVFNGLKGYLMTITSEAENKFIYDQLFKKKNISGNKAAAWLGASRSINQAANGTYDSPTWKVGTSALNDYWSWVCGPEAGKKFYTKATVAEGGVAADKENGEKWFVYWNGGEPNSSGTEYCAQYVGDQYRWNDLNNNGNGSEPYYVYYYIVEFTPYENPAVGISIPTDSSYKPRLHAEQVYD